MLTSIYSQGWITARPRKALKGDMELFHKLMYKLVNKGVFPRRKDAIRHPSKIWAEQFLGKQIPIGLPSLIIKHMTQLVDHKHGPHQLAFGNLLIIVFKAFEVSFFWGGGGREGYEQKRYDHQVYSF